MSTRTVSAQCSVVRAGRSGLKWVRFHHQDVNSNNEWMLDGGTESSIIGQSFLMISNPGPMWIDVGGQRAVDLAQE